MRVNPGGDVWNALYYLCEVDIWDLTTDSVHDAIWRDSQRSVRMSVAQSMHADLFLDKLTEPW